MIEDATIVVMFQSRSESGGGKNDVENRYSAEYENKLDPFTTFSQRVSLLVPFLSLKLIESLCLNRMG